MERRRIDDCEPGPVPSPKPLDRFGFVKQDGSTSPEHVGKRKSATEFDRYFFLFTSQFQKFYSNRGL